MRIELAQNVMQRHNAQARENARALMRYNVFAVDVMGAPGAGKTELLERTVEAMARNVRMAVIEGDVCTARDARRLQERGAQAIQINTGGACHLDADMVAEVLEDLSLLDIDLLFIENVGNLICPTHFPSGAAERVIVLSLPEGADKPEKYPAMFQSCSGVLVNKMDLAGVLPVYPAEVVQQIGRVNGEMNIWPVCARTGEGMEEWYEWLHAGLRRFGRYR